MKKGENKKSGERNLIPLGTKFGKLTTISESQSIKKRWGYHKITKEPIYTTVFHYEVMCECGNVRFLPKTQLTTGVMKTCGCTKLGIKQYKDIPRWLIRMFKSQADAKNKKWDVSLEYLGDLYEQQKRKCMYTGWELQINGAKQSKTASLDRINSSKGYIEGNVQWVHKDVNIAKNKLSHEDFIKLCQDVSKKFI
jgi:hypothetical protein